MLERDTIFSKPGTLILPTWIVEDYPLVAMHILKDLLIVRAEERMVNRAIFYDCYSEKFKPCDPSCIISYSVCIQDTEISFERREDTFLMSVENRNAEEAIKLLNAKLKNKLNPRSRKIII